MVKAKTAVPKVKSVSGTTASKTVVPVDVIFIVDVTGSMGGYIQAAKRFLTDSMKNIEGISPLLDNSYSLIVYRDHPPQDHSFVTKILANAGNVSDLSKSMQMSAFKADGGGDTPEAGLDGIKDISKLNLRPGSIRHAFIIGDAPLHGTDGKQCKCGMTSVSAKTILERYNIVLTGVNVARYSPTTTSFATIASKVIEVNESGGVEIIKEALKKVCANVVWAVSTVLPILKEDKYQPIADIAEKCSSNINDVNAAIETLNQLEITATL